MCKVGFQATPLLLGGAPMQHGCNSPAAHSTRVSWPADHGCIHHPFQRDLFMRDDHSTMCECCISGMLRAAPC